MVTKHGKQVTPRKIVLQPKWDDEGNFIGVLRSYTAEAKTDFGAQDIGQLGEEMLEASDMTETQLTAYAEMAKDFDKRAVEELGCEQV
jgi:hypothetical protein